MSVTAASAQSDQVAQTCDLGPQLVDLGQQLRPRRLDVLAGLLDQHGQTGSNPQQSERS